MTRPLLSVNNIEVIYDHVILVLKGVSLCVPEGGIVALLGANGAGKSTTLKSISGLLRTERGNVTKGTIEFRGQPIHRKDPAEVVKRGIVQVMEGRHVFEHLTVEENLLTGGYTRRNGHSTKQELELVYHYFPRLAERRQGRLHLRRRAADGGDRPRAHGPAQAHAARRALDGAGADAGERDLRDRQPHEPRGGRRRPARRAERHDGAPVRSIRLRDGERAHRPRRRRQDDQRERGHQGVLPGALRRRPAEELPRREALPP